MFVAGAVAWVGLRGVAGGIPRWVEVVGAWSKHRGRLARVLLMLLGWPKRRVCAIVHSNDAAWALRRDLSI